MKAKYVFFDFETDGIGRVPMQRAIQLAWIVTDEGFKTIKEKSYYVTNDPKRIKICTKFHGEEVCKQMTSNCYEMSGVLTEFLNDVFMAYKNDGRLVAHNIEFDLTILCRECEACGINLVKSKIDKLCECTMKKSWFIKKKNLRLEDLHKTLHGGGEIDLKGGRLHEALTDTRVLLACYKKLHEGHDMLATARKLISD